jgi:hypothetical protein
VFPELLFSNSHDQNTWLNAYQLAVLDLYRSLRSYEGVPRESTNTDPGAQRPGRARYTPSR